MGHRNHDMSIGAGSPEWDALVEVLNKKSGNVEKVKIGKTGK